MYSSQININYLYSKTQIHLLHFTLTYETATFVLEQRCLKYLFFFRHHLVWNITLHVTYTKLGWKRCI